MYHTCDPLHANYTESQKRIISSQGLGVEKLPKCYLEGKRTNLNWTSIMSQASDFLEWSDEHITLHMNFYKTPWME